MGCNKSKPATPAVLLGSEVAKEPAKEQTSAATVAAAEQSPAAERGTEAPKAESPEGQAPAEEAPAEQPPAEQSTAQKPPLEPLPVETKAATDELAPGEQTPSPPREVSKHVHQEDEVQDDFSGQMLKIVIISAKGLRDADPVPFQGKSDPYCVCEIQGRPKSRVQTEVVSGSRNPEWNFEAELENYQPGTPLIFTVYDQDYNMDDFLGTVTLDGEKFRKQKFEGELDLEKAGNTTARLKVRVPAAEPEVGCSLFC
mmetsp:Transcript_76677/g.232423  ORF Transcript_76677/g.232423 Transcript_76677/m.232423 type:complete len:256 (-) Transcript_76677:39-806(-)